MTAFKEIDDIQVTTTALFQLIDIVQNDISGSATRKKYPMFVSSSNDGTVVGEYSITSSLFQTVYDQDYTLQVANPIFDMTVGLFVSGNTVQDTKIGDDPSGKILFNSSSAMMREKIDIYNLHLQKLKAPPSEGDARDYAFYAPADSSADVDRIDEAIFIDLKRLFYRDALKPETFAMRFYTTATLDGSPYATTAEKGIVSSYSSYTGTNINKTSNEPHTLFTDIRATSDQTLGIDVGGRFGTIRAASNANDKVGLIYYDSGILVLDAKKIMYKDQHASGTINATTSSVSGINTTIIGSASLDGSNKDAKFIPDFFVSASIDDIVTHIASCRFSSGSYTGITFQNQTTVNSTLVFCRATADEFNYSSNPTYTDEDGNIIVIDNDPATEQKSVTFPTTVGLYDNNNNLLAVAKLSRPIEKNYEKDLTIRVRLDF